MTKTQKYLLEMLKEIDTICKKHNITYYLIGGSALGAIRHHGFIPWDDDADIVMTRDNCLKFEAVIDKEIRPDRRYMTWQRTPDYPAVFARYTNTNTTCIVNSLSYSPIDWGLMIDIFVLTPLPNKEKQRHNFHNYMKMYGEIVNPFFPVNAKSNYFQYKLYTLIAQIIGTKHVLSFITKKIYSYDESQCTHYSYGYPRVHMIYKKEIFSEPRLLPFEDTFLPVPTKVEEHLRILFGETWMLLPDENNQVSEHRMLVDLARSFDFYTEDYLFFSPYKKIMIAYKNWKSWRMKVLNKNFFRKLTIIKFNFYKDILEWNNFWTQFGNQIIQYYENAQFKNISSLIQDYYKLFNKKEYLDNLFLIPLTDKQFEILTYMLNRDGYYYIVLNLYNIMEKKKLRVNIQYQKLNDLAFIKQQMIHSFDINNKNSETKLNELISEFPEDYTLLFIFLTYYINIKNFNRTLIKSRIDLGITCFFKDGAFQKFKGDYLLTVGNYEGAVKEYLIAKSYLKNGLLLTRINDFLSSLGN